ncbi:hypothetical protein MMC17_007571 [Xylographa soralifera]|nr:hypothetical protein [Xylographa soralifera]
MDVWCGHIKLNRLDTNNRLEDVRISLPQEEFGTSRWVDVHLQLLSFVDTAAIPLHLIAGPSFDVFTSNEHTESWLSDRLLRSSQSGDSTDQQLSRWWENKCGQSDVGLLLQVDGEIKIAPCGSRVTELLIHAGLPRYGDQDNVGMLTPPRSSSPITEHEGLPEDFDGPIRSVNIYALPLSSDLSCGLREFPDSPSPSSEETFHEYAQFIPLPIEDRSHHKGRKRLHLDSLFQDATHQVKRSKRRGGESVAKAMASFDNMHSQTVEQSTSSYETAGSGTQVPAPLVFGKPRFQRNNGLSRAHSLGSVRDLDQIRPLSRGNAVPVRRSTLSRLASVGAFESSSPIPESLNSIEQQNKVALSRVVMAGMRMYGLQQRKKSDRSRAASEIPPSAGVLPTTSAIAEEEDDYKLVYHQTYKAASFAFRKHMPVANIGQDCMRDVVDRILEMFCIDLLANPKPIGTIRQGFEAEVIHANSPFDLQSYGEQQACE